MNRLWPVWLITIVGLPASLIFSAVNGFISPVGFGLGLLFVAIYLVAGILLFRAGPLWPSAGPLYVVACLVWGAAISLGLVFLPALGWVEITDRLGWDAVQASFAGAYPEEIAKALGVLVMLYAFRRLNRPWHGFVTGGLVGLGFEVNENLLYGAVGAVLDANSDFDGAVQTWGVRLLAGPGLHIVLTALSGWGIGLALFQRDSLKGLWWVFVAFSLHFLWNIMWPTEVAMVAHYVVMSAIIYPLFMWIYVQAVRRRKSDNSYVLLM
ncbi:hypothetical protein CKALI_00865 [Corynebacterium kalinowskii]|uniref:PrsW family intramembrane metalloprotease n=1 Tax=Corynebacterium kalinowskii TaxID=2675216 RepID=A0A6B8VHJ7_9CORY|nr:hypothetical protein CKALI_00865 [Corynebacterium kalinowskii]